MGRKTPEVKITDQISGVDNAGRELKMFKLAWLRSVLVVGVVALSVVEEVSEVDCQSVSQSVCLSVCCSLRVHVQKFVGDERNVHDAQLSRPLPAGYRVSLSVPGSPGRAHSRRVHLLRRRRRLI